MPSKHRSNETREVVKPILQWLAASGFVVLDHKRKAKGVHPKLQPLDGFRKAAWILEHPDSVRGVVWRQNTGQAPLIGQGGRSHPIRFGEPGMADIVGILRGGRWLAIECKRQGGKIVADSQQDAFRKVIEALGGVHILATSIEDVADGLSGITSEREAVSA